MRAYNAPRAERSRRRTFEQQCFGSSCHSKAGERIGVWQLSAEFRHIEDGTNLSAGAQPPDPQPLDGAFAYGAYDDAPSIPEAPIPAGTEIDEEWFSGDTEYWDERAEELAEREARQVRRHPIARGLVAAVTCIALVLLVAWPFGGITEFVDFFVNGVPGGTEEQSVQEDAGSPANFIIQKSFNYPKSAHGPQLSGDAALPAYFLTNRQEATTAKLQSPWKSCWAFAGTAALESSVLKARHAKAKWTENTDYSAPKLTGLATDPDYSERHLAWFSHERQTKASAGGQAGEGLYATVVENGEQLTGGSLTFADVLFTTSSGIVSEQDEPYCYNGYTENDIPFYQLGRSKGDVPAKGDKQDARNRDWSLEDAHVTDSNGVVVKAAHMLPSPVKTKQDDAGSIVYAGYDKRATAAFKQALVEYGAIAFAYRADVSKPGVELLRYGDGKCFSYENWAQYDNAEHPTTNHAATIVGWDDTYPASKFSGSVAGSPPADGAWLVKNSWGSEELYRQLGVNAADARRMAHGLNGSGFFWLSYYDHTISMPYVFEVSLDDSAAATTVYQYDYLAVSDTAIPLEMSPVPEVANVFEAQEDGELYAVSARTYKPASTVQVSVVKLGSGAVKPDDGEEVASLKTEVAYGGFTVLDLEEAVKLKAGERFAVIERIVDPKKGKQGYMNLETVAREEIGTQRTNVVANEGETFVRFSGESTWRSPFEMRQALANEDVEVVALGNAMIKAYLR